MEHVEGHESVMAALGAYKRRFQVVLVRQGTRSERADAVLSLAASRGIPVRFAEAVELDAIAHGASHGGIIALCTPKPRATPEELLALVAARPDPLLLLLEGVEDARNLGFTLRSAEALGVHAVLIKKHLWDFDPVEVARPSSGAYERLPLVQVEGIDLLLALKRRGVSIFGCIASARRTLYERDLAGPVLLAVGGEKRGLSGAVRSVCDGVARIPLAGGAASSLSLSHASAIVLAEAMRQRLARAAPAAPDADTAPEPLEDPLEDGA